MKFRYEVPVYSVDVPSVYSDLRDCHLLTGKCVSPSPVSTYANTNKSFYVVPSPTNTLFINLVKSFKFTLKYTITFSWRSGSTFGGGCRVSLFCFPSVGNVVWYFAWASFMYGLQPAFYQLFLVWMRCFFRSCGLLCCWALEFFFFFSLVAAESLFSLSSSAGLVYSWFMLWWFFTLKLYYVLWRWPVSVVVTGAVVRLVVLVSAPILLRVAVVVLNNSH